MKDYSLGLNKYFILRYEVDKENNKITIYYNNDVVTEEYSKTREKEILEKMKEQITIRDNFEERREIFIKTYGIGAILEYLVTFSNITLAILNSSILNGFFGGIFFGIGTFYTQKMLKNHFLLEDYKKTMLFLENEEKINEYLKSIDYGTLMPVEGQMTSLNINDVDKMSTKELKKLIQKSAGR